MRHVLCIDDSVARYGMMYRTASKEGILLTITDNPELIRMILRFPIPECPLIGICLDHDMPGRDAVEIARNLIGPHSIPVAIVSNNHDGCLRLAAVLEEYAVPNQRMPAGAGGMGWEEWVLDWFKSQEKSR
jgi:CheY-like chemotaxis protein